MAKNMSGFVNHENTKHRPDSAYGEVIDAIKKDGVCPFCPEHLATYHKNQIIAEGAYWLLTNNMYPYQGTKYHVLILHKKHIESFSELTPAAWAELHRMVADHLAKNKIPGGTFVLRFGDTDYTGASVKHLHANLVSPHGEDKDREPIVVRIG